MGTEGVGDVECGCDAGHARGDGWRLRTAFGRLRHDRALGIGEQAGEFLGPHAQGLPADPAGDDQRAGDPDGHRERSSNDPERGSHSDGKAKCFG